MKIIFYYNDGEKIEKDFTVLQDKLAIENGILRGLYSIALETPDFFKRHYMVGYEVIEYDETLKREIIIDTHIYKKIERKKS